MRVLSIAFLCLALLSTSGCKKEEGEGGRAVIKGTVLRQDVNAVGNPIGEPYPFHDQRVYIIYGDNEFQDDDVRTGPDGNYEFRWLRKGDYTIYTFGECDCPGKSITVSHRVSIDGKKDEVVVPTITVDNF